MCFFCTTHFLVMQKLTKHSAQFFLKQKENTKESKYAPIDSVRFTNNKKLLEECRDMYDKLRPFRDKATRNINYTLGRQWEDRIIDPEGAFWGQSIKEEDYIKRQGKVPLKYNVMNKSKKSIIGTFRQNKQEPIAIARERDDQKLGEMMTIALQYVYNTNNVYELNARLLENCWATGLFIRSVYFRHDSERQMPDVYVQNENPFMIFFNSDAQDAMLRDITTIGAIRDMDISDLISAFAETEADAKALIKEYEYINKHRSEYLYAFDKDRNLTECDFYVSRDAAKCRVFEVWRLESKRCLYCHDRAQGTECYREISEQAEIDEENKRRVDEMVSLGFSPDDANLIEYKWFVRKYWYVRYLTPTGNCIHEGETPFEHGSHPFTIGAYPMLNGEICSPAEELIDIQRGINRRLSQIDFLIQNSAKGVLLCPIDAVPDSMTPQQFASEYTRNGAVLFYKPKPGVEIPKQITSASVSAGELEVVRLYMQLNDEVSGVSSALRGEKPTNGTPAARYAQEAQNSATNIEDFIGWFNTNIRQSDYKMMNIIQQYYDDERYIPIAGKNFSEEAKFYTPSKIRRSQFDLNIVESTSTPAYRMALEDTLMKALELGAMDFKTYLEASASPFADNLLEIIKRNEQAAAEQAGGQSAGGVPPLTPQSPMQQQAAQQMAAQQPQ